MEQELPPEALLVHLQKIVLHIILEQVVVTLQVPVQVQVVPKVIERPGLPRMENVGMMRNRHMKIEGYMQLEAVGQVLVEQQLTGREEHISRAVHTIMNRLVVEGKLIEVSEKAPLQARKVIQELIREEGEYQADTQAFREPENQEPEEMKLDQV